MKIEKEKKKRVFQVFYEACGSKPMYEIVFAVQKNEVVGTTGRTIVEIKEVVIN